MSSLVRRLDGGSWLLAPSVRDLLFSFRTTATSLAALAIAMWMELGQPQWAAMTVWIVAQNTVGESLSKAHWRVVGTMAGAASAIVLAAVAPQEPWLFFPLLALWIGLCAGLGTLCHNYRSYTFVLMGFTCAIISISAIDAPDHVFDIAVARSTYILLGVVCEMTVALLCEPSVAMRARLAVRAQLRGIVEDTVSAVGDILHGRTPSERDLYRALSGALTLDDRMNFSALEVGHSGPMVAQTRATLGQAAILTSRGWGMQTRLALSAAPPGEIAQPVLTEISLFLDNLPPLLASDADVGRLCARATDLGRLCDAAIRKLAGSEGEEAARRRLVDDRIVLQGAALLLNELMLLLRCFSGAETNQKILAGLRLARPANWRSAFANGVRSLLAVLIAASIWEVTAWSSGPLFVMFVSVVCARFASFSNTVIASKNFFLGAVWAVVAAVVPVFFVMPVTSDYPIFCLATAVPMIVGGLVNRRPATAAMGASFVNFFPFMLMPENHFRTDEVQWFNVSVALLSGLGFGVLVFRYVFPFNFSLFYLNFRALIDSGLRDIVRYDGKMTDQTWLGAMIERMERLLAHEREAEAGRIDAWLSRAFFLLTVGRNLLYLKRLLQGTHLAPPIETEIVRLFDCLGRRAAMDAEKHMAVIAAEEALYRIEAASTDAVQRIQASDVIGCLAIIARAFEQSGGFPVFLDTR